MALRIEFSTQDLSRVVIGRPPRVPVSEALMGLQVLLRRAPAVRFHAWRRAMDTHRVHPGPALRGLVPARGWFPDFLTPGAFAWPEAGAYDAIRATPTHRLCEELARLSAHHRLPSWGGDLAQGHAPALGSLTEDLAAFYDTAIGTFAPALRAVTDADRAARAARAQTLAFRGLDALLRELHPTITWNPPHLVLASPREATFRLEGRGLIISGHFFCWPRPRVQLNDTDAPVLIHPVAWDPTRDQSPGMPNATDTAPTLPRNGRALAAALGTTRARILLTIADLPSSTTAELAQRLDISLASASEHATVLRQAGLITSRRSHRTVHHSPTALGNGLLNRPR